MENDSPNSGLASGLAAPTSAAARRAKRPVWLSTVGYFSVSLGASIALFLIVLNLLDENTEREAPWIAAAIAAAAMFGLAMLAREVVLRRARTRFLLRAAHFDVPVNHKKTDQRAKFSLEQNTAALALIEKKSKQAESSLDAPELHLEVFRICREYLDLVEKELSKVHIGSPRLPALRHGQERVQTLHKKHLLAWANEATRKLTREAAVRVEVKEKVESAQRALEVLASALQIYPLESQLVESAAAVREFIVSIRVSDHIGLAERAAFKGHYRRAIDHYTDALFDLSRETQNGETFQMRARLEHEIERLRSNLAQKKNGRSELPFNQ